MELQLEYWTQQSSAARARGDTASVLSYGSQMEKTAEALRTLLLSKAKIAAQTGDTVDRAAVESHIRAYNQSIKRNLIAGIHAVLSTRFPEISDLRQLVADAYESSTARLVEIEF